MPYRAITVINARPVLVPSASIRLKRLPVTPPVPDHDDLLTTDFAIPPIGRHGLDSYLTADKAPGSSDH